MLLCAVSRSQSGGGGDAWPDGQLAPSLLSFATLRDPSGAAHSGGESITQMLEAASEHGTAAAAAAATAATQVSGGATQVSGGATQVSGGATQVSGGATLDDAADSIRWGRTPTTQGYQP